MWQCVTVAPGLQEQLRDRLADEVRGTDDGRVEAAQRFAGGLQQPHHAERRAGAQAGKPERERAGAGRIEPVDVLVRRDARGDLDPVEVLGHRKLAEDAVDRGVLVELVDELEHLGARRAGAQLELVGGDAGLLARAVLAGDVDAAGGVVADDQRGQARLAAVAEQEAGGVLGDRGALGGRDGLAVDDAGRRGERGEREHADAIRHDRSRSGMASVGGGAHLHPGYRDPAPELARMSVQLRNGDRRGRPA